MSSRSVAAFSSFAQACTEDSEEMSHLRKLSLTFGDALATLVLSASALRSFRPLKMICAGSCLASSAMEPAPSPAVPMIGNVRRRDGGRLGYLEPYLQ